MPGSGRMTTADVIEHYRSGPASGVFTDGSFGRQCGYGRRRRARPARGSAATPSMLARE